LKPHERLLQHHSVVDHTDLTALKQHPQNLFLFSLAQPAIPDSLGQSPRTSRANIKRQNHPEGAELTNQQFGQTLEGIIFMLVNKSLKPLSRLQLWEPDITEEVRTIARDRILDGGNLATRKDLGSRTIKLALILVREMNPAQVLNDAEDALLMGIGVKALRSLRQNREMIYTVNA
jgi:hypothetical protein